MEGLIIIFSIIWGILCIILFFKIWGMTNDVAKLTQIIEKIAISKGYQNTDTNYEKKFAENSEESAESKTETKDKTKLKKSPSHSFKLGDEVIHSDLGIKMKVVCIRGSRITCEKGYLGTETYNASELKHFNEDV